MSLPLVVRTLIQWPPRNYSSASNLLLREEKASKTWARRNLSQRLILGFSEDLAGGTPGAETTGGQLEEDTWVRLLGYASLLLVTGHRDFSPVHYSDDPPAASLDLQHGTKYCLPELQASSMRDR